MSCALEMIRDVPDGGDRCGQSPIASAESCLLREALDGIESGIALGSISTGRFVYMNAYACRVCGRLSEHLDLRVLGERLRSPDDRGAHRSAQLTRLVIRCDGRWIGLSVYPVSKDLLVILLKDVTREQLAHGSPLREDQRRALVGLFSRFRHEIGNPLNSIKMSLQVLAANLDVFSQAKVRTYIARTVEEVGRLEGLLRSLRIMTQQEDLQLSEIDLRLCLGKFRGLVEGECQACGVRLTVAVDEAARFVVAHVDSLDQVLHNLLRNASEARRGEVCRIRISTRPGVTPGTVTLEIEDDGVGIPADLLPVIFQPMYTTKERGTGFGLAVVDELVGRMGGTISVRSEVGQGTTFGLHLPAGEPL
jgi:signal transduction histidine kinase